MSKKTAIHLSGVGKMYKIFATRTDNFLDALALTWARPWRRVKPREFWALRDINFELKAGSRLGIIGRNGAGKSTLLKLITGNLQPTEGRVHVNGQIQALLDAGAGFHPEFTGLENIRAALIYQGYSPKEMGDTIKDIMEFTELGQFLNQPLKTYSSGMASRLTFAAATAVKPSILIIDEILGAGDAYFAGKSAERMKRLVEESGASVLLVSHGMGEILRYCDECIWIERGRIVKHGPSLEVIKAYEEFIHTLDDRRLKAKNRKRQLFGQEAANLDIYDDTVVLTFQLQGAPKSHCDIAEIMLLKNGKEEETLRVGDVQDASWSHVSVLSMDGSNWSEPLHTAEGYSRRLIIEPDGPSVVLGQAVFYSHLLYDEAQYSFRVRYRCSNAGKLTLTIVRNTDKLQDQVVLPSSGTKWTELDFSVVLPFNNPSLPPLTRNIENGTATEYRASDLDISSFAQEENEVNTVSAAKETTTKSAKHLIRKWPGEGSLVIEKVWLLNSHEQEQAVFSVGSELILKTRIQARRSGHYNFVPTATLFRLDGIFVSNFMGNPIPLDFAENASRDFCLRLGKVNLGDGQYIFSVAIYKDKVDDKTRFDLHDRSYEFEVIGNVPLLASAIFQHQGDWTSR